MITNYGCSISAETRYFLRERNFISKKQRRDIRLSASWELVDTCGGVEMNQEFVGGVHSIVEPLLTELGFRLDEVRDVVEYGRAASVAFFRSMDCKIQVYDAPREGEINCMIAPVDAANVLGLYDQSGKWQYLPRFAIRRGVPREEIMKDKAPVDFPTTDQLLESVRRRIEKYFPIAHEGVLEMDGPEYWTSGP